MPFAKSLRAKILLSALIPGTLVLVVVAVIVLYAYERVARDVVEQRDTEQLARVSAARLSEALTRHSRPLLNLASEVDVQSLERDRLSSAIERAQSQLAVFDGGVVVYNSEGVAIWSRDNGDLEGTSFPLPSAFDEVRSTLRPVFSNVFTIPGSLEDAVLIGVPIAGAGNEFKGVLGGMANIQTSLLSATLAEVLEFKAGRSGFGYLVDGNGRVVYHRNSSQLARDLSANVAVKRSREGGRDRRNPDRGYRGQEGGFRLRSRS